MLGSVSVGKTNSIRGCDEEQSLPSKRSIVYLTRLGKVSSSVPPAISTHPLTLITSGASSTDNVPPREKFPKISMD